MGKSQDLGGLQKCAQFDHQNKVKLQMTGWGVICKMRAEKKISRKARRQMKRGQ